MAQQLVMSILTSKVVNGLEMGVFNDGSGYMTGRSVARLCGVTPSTIFERTAEWDAGDRTGRFARSLSSTGFDEATLAAPVKHTGSGVAADASAYPERVVMAFLEYYAFEVNKAEALSNYRVLSRAGLRFYIYGQVGYDPKNAVPPQWRAFQDRMIMHNTPSGYFSVFKEMADLVLTAIRNGLVVDAATIPDISVGQAWASYWRERNFEATYGPSIKHDHNYPDYFPQAASNPQPINVYPTGALGEFRIWFERIYVVERFPRYLDGKVGKGQIAASTAELLLEAVQGEKQLPPGPAM